MAGASDEARAQLRWRLADEYSGPQQALFEEEPPTWRAGHGEFRGLEFLEVKAQRVINPVPPQSRMSFRWTINAYRGCSHSCSYCSSGETPILMADGRTKPLADVRVGDRIYGTERGGTYRRYVITTVLDHWSVVKPAYRTVLEDGTELVTSGDHRFLSDRGWKHVTGTECGRHRRPHLTLNNRLIGTGAFARAPEHDVEYRRGYLAGMIRGDGNLGQEAVGERTDSWCKGFLAGIFDAEGCHSQQVLRITNKDTAILETIDSSLKRFAFPHVREPARQNGVACIRITGGIREHLRFFQTVDPAITRKRSFEGVALEPWYAVPLRVKSIEPLGLELPLYDMGAAPQE